MTAAPSACNGTQAAPDREPLVEVIESTLKVFHPGDTTFELRSIRHDGRRLGQVYRGQHKQAAREAARLNRDGFNVYLTLNPVVPGLVGKSAHDGDVVELHWLPTDVDPFRPADTMATEDELVAAWEVHRAVLAELTAAGLRKPVVGASGNGAHASFPIMLPTANKELVKHALKLLDQKHSGSRARVDTTVFNPSRIWRVYGTVNRKGPDTAERPHRLSALVEGYPWCLEVAEANTLALRQWLALHPEPPRRPPGATHNDARGNPYAEAALANELGKIFAAPVGKRNDQLNRSAFALGQLVGAGALARERVEEALLGVALAAGLTESESRRTIRSGLEAGVKEPRDLSEIGPKRKRKQSKKETAPPSPPSTSAPDATSGSPPAVADSYSIILRHLRDHYQPVYRVGTSIYSGTLSREVRQGEACGLPGIAVIEALTQATDAPKARGGNNVVDRGALPAIFRTWAPVAYADLLTGLKEQAATAEIDDGAKERFVARLSGAMQKRVALGESHGKEGTVTELRPLIDWAERFAKSNGKRWGDVRGLRCWSRLPSASQLPVRIAIRVELWTQLNIAELARLTQQEFSALCVLYDVGSPCKVKGGDARAVELAPEFVARVQATPEPEEGDEPPERKKPDTRTDGQRTHTPVYE